MSSKCKGGYFTRKLLATVLLTSVNKFNNETYIFTQIQIATKKPGHFQVGRAKLISVHKSTLNREPRRNHGSGYRPSQAYRLALGHRQEK